MLKKLFFVLLASGASLAATHAQTCGTDDLYQQLKKEHKEIGVYEAQLEEAFHKSMQQINLSRFAKTTGGNDTVIYDVPIVIHIVHDYGAEFVTDNSIIAAVNNWIDVYMKRNADTIDVIAPFKPYIGHPRIRLHLATIDPDGNPTKGITRRQSYLTRNAGDQAKLDQWPQNKYLNIWFVNKFSGDHAGAAAYAYYPSSGAAIPYYDGIIGLYSYMNYDKAIPHEIGHVLNLQHTWGNTNAPDVACGDDQVDDTPPTKGHLTVGCVPAALYDVTCAVGYTKTYVINGITTVIDYPDTTNAQNIMDYTYCQKMFTLGQVDRMRAALTSSVAGRNNWYAAANLAATGAMNPMPDLPPVPEFSVEKGQITVIPLTTERCVFLGQGSELNFVFANRSWNDTITDVQWTFSNNATNPTSTSLNTVMNQFGTRGWVSVSLTATGNNSGSKTMTNPQAVYVADSVMQNAATYRQNFGVAASTSNWPMFNYYNNQFKWEWYNGAGYGDNACVRYRSFDNRTSPANKTGTPVGDYDDMFTPGFDLSGYNGGNLNLNFYTAGSYTSGSYTDTMDIAVSTDLGRTWFPLKTIAGSDLINNNFQFSEFVPASASQWKGQTVNIPATYQKAKVFFRLRFRPGANGNNLYLDNFSISQFATEVNETAANPESVRLAPNPAHGGTKLMFTTGADGKVSYAVKDITGKLIYQQEKTYGANTFAVEDLSASLFHASGVYLVTVTIANKSTTQKLVIEQ